MIEGGNPSLLTRIVAVLRNLFRLIVTWVTSITINRPPGLCAGIGELSEGFHPNPVQCNDVAVAARDTSGGLMVYPGRPGPETQIRRIGGIKGFDAAHELEKTFPVSSKVVVQAAYFDQPARIEAYSAGTLTQIQMMRPMPGVIQDIVLVGASLNRVLVIPSGDTLVIELCH